MEKKRVKTHQCVYTQSTDAVEISQQLENQKVVSLSSALAWSLRPPFLNGSFDTGVESSRPGRQLGFRG